MSLKYTLETVFEIALVVFTLWSLFHEDKYIAFEDRIIAYFRRRRLKVIRGGRDNASVCRESFIKER